MRFEELDVWKRAARLSAGVYQALSSLKDYGFKDQITRANLSVPSNIAEGFERLTTRDCIKFLGYAKGSCGEVRTQVYVGMEIGYIERSLGTRWVRETEEISRMLHGLIKSLNANRSFEPQGSSNK